MRVLGDHPSGRELLLGEGPREEATLVGMRLQFDDDSARQLEVTKTHGVDFSNHASTRGR